MRRFMRILSIVFIFTFGLDAQGFEFSHPELSWRTIETEHFYVHFQDHTNRTAALVAKIAEEIYGPITTLYDYRPDTKIHFIIKDYNDYANGAAYYYDNKIEFWAPAVLDFPFRGTHSWLRNTITHEFSHMISLGSARKFPRQLQAFYFQWLGYEKEKRKDVIHGYPNMLISIPYPGTIMPMWFAEGVAQYQRAGLEYETWDTHRDMLLRTVVLSGSCHTLDEMGYFDKNSLGNERVYNQGYGLTRYIASQYGESSLSALTRAMAKPIRISFSKASESVFGKTDQALYDEWMEWLRNEYTRNTDLLQHHLSNERIIESKGLANFYAEWSPDGQQFAYLSNRGHDYLSLRSLWIYDMKTEKARLVKAGVSSSVSWSPDGKHLVYAKHKLNKNKCEYFDLFVYDLENQKELQITNSRRARQPDWGENGTIVCVIEEDGVSNLVVVNSDGSDFKQITQFYQGESIHLPRWMPDGRIVFAMSEENEGRDIAVINADGSGFEYLIKTDNDERDPWPSLDGEYLFYSSDKSGIFNLYRRQMNSGEETLVSNVLGGAFLPAVNKQGQCVFSRFDSDGFKLALMDSMRAIDPGYAIYRSPYAQLPAPSDSRTWDIAEFDDREKPEYKSTPYKSMYGKFAFLPRLMIDFPGKLKAGSYFYSSDFLEKFSFFGGVAVNTQFDTDIYGIFEYKKLGPNIFLELYQVSRKTSESDTYIETDVNYNLLGATLGIEKTLNKYNILRTTYDYSRYRSAGSGIVKYQNVFFKFASTYHKGSVFGLEWKHKAIPPTLQSHIAPRSGRHFSIKLDYAMQSFYDSTAASAQYGTPVDIYNQFRYFQMMLDWYEFLPGFYKTHSISVRLHGGYIDRYVDSFYHLYAGGLDGMKGYPFYSMEGRKLAQAELAYLFPIKRNMNLKLAMFRFKDAYLSIYGNVGDAWTHNKFEPSRFKKDVGLQLRLSLFSYYAFPMKLAFDAAYGLDSYQVRDVTYGKEWRYYLTVLFDFLDLINSGQKHFMIR